LQKKNQGRGTDIAKTKKGKKPRSRKKGKSVRGETQTVRKAGPTVNEASRDKLTRHRGEKGKTPKKEEGERGMRRPGGIEIKNKGRGRKKKEERSGREDVQEHKGPT